MTILKNVHHINFIVADLDAAVGAYQSTLGLGSFKYEEHPERAVSTARVRVGDTWIVLVAPHSKESVPGRYLEAHGEGFFLLSFGVDSLQQAIAALSQRGAIAADKTPRSGIQDWRVVDLDTRASLGVNFHLTQAVPE